MNNDHRKPSNVVDFKTVKTAKKCLKCTKKVVQEFKPFCSKRCADLDLGKWLGEGYRIPSQEAPGYEEEE